MGEVNRKIHFFQVEWINENGEKVQKDINFIDSILNSCSNKVIEFSRDRLVVQKYEGTSLSSNNRSLWRLEKIRKEDLPLKFDESQLKEEPLDLEDYEGLAEPSHFVIFDGKIIGAEYNYYGARWINSKLVRIINDYLSQNPSDVIRVEIKPVFRRELYRLLEKFVEIRRITIKIATNYAKLLSKEDPESFGKMFSAAELIDGVWLTMSFTIGSRRHVERSRFNRIMGAIKKLLERTEAAENLKLMEVRGRIEEGGSIETLNLLEEMLVSEKRVAKLDERSRAVNPESMFREIIDSYYTFKDEISEYVRQS